MNIAPNHQAFTLDELQVPLCVDLDGTLIRTDLLHEAVIQLLRTNVLNLFRMVVWMMRGKSAFKAEVAARIAIDAERLPYNEVLLRHLRDQREAGRALVLATASPRVWADAVADHLDLFDSVEATDDAINLASTAKGDRLAALYGEGGFDYAGNSRHDIAVWQRARHALLVTPDAAARSYAARSDAETLIPPAGKSLVRVWAKAARIHQWLKNTLLFVPGVLAFSHFDATVFADLLVAFLSFSLVASSVYLLNDTIDVPSDRRHATKSKRPIASGEISVPQALAGSFVTLVAGLGLAMLLPVAFTAIVALYAGTTLAYSFFVKRLLLLDVLTLAGLFSLRVFAGAAAIEQPISTWLLAFCVFFFLSLALVKRFVELDGTTETGKLSGRGYRRDDLDVIGQAGLSSAFAAIVVLALFIDSPEIAQNYDNPHLIWLVLPLVLYVVVRIWILARRQEMNDDPVVFIMTDWRSQIMIGLGAVIMLGSQMLPAWL